MESQLDSLDALTFDTENTSDDDDDAAELGKLGMRADVYIDEEAGLLDAPQARKPKRTKKRNKRTKKPELKEMSEQAGMPFWKIACCLMCTVMIFTVAYILVSTMQVPPGQNKDPVYAASVALVCSVQYAPLELPPLDRGEITKSTAVGSPAVSCAPSNSHCCCTIVTLLSQCCYIVVTLLLHSCYTVCHTTEKTWLAVTALLQTPSGIMESYRCNSHLIPFFQAFKCSKHVMKISIRDLLALANESGAVVRSVEDAEVT
jgi:hypothetical protein